MFLRFHQNLRLDVLIRLFLYKKRSVKPSKLSPKLKLKLKLSLAKIPFWLSGQQLVNFMPSRSIPGLQIVSGSTFQEAFYKIGLQKLWGGCGGVLLVTLDFWKHPKIRWEEILELVVKRYHYFIQLSWCIMLWFMYCSNWKDYYEVISLVPCSWFK